jgi:coproporphyrinogen III oxidase
MKVAEQQALIVAYLKDLRDKIIAQFEALETEGRFIRSQWNYEKGSGGGEMSVLRGKVFEKAAVNWSGVSGETFPMRDGSGPFFATGVSLITHMANPHAPTVHMNIRYIETDEGHWLGGGYDLTPMGFPYEEDREHFHQIAKEALGEDLYATFSQNAKEYFYIPHRKKERGVGGIFFDHFNTGDFEADLKMWKNVGDTFCNAIMPIYQRRIHLPFTEEQRQEQLRLRSHYVEYNLLYDRGTKFGFLSGGNPDAILCSLPPLVSW